MPVGQCCVCVCQCKAESSPMSPMCACVSVLCNNNISNFYCLQWVYLLTWKVAVKLMLPSLLFTDYQTIFISCASY